jgi:hypothetical protein
MQEGQMMIDAEVARLRKLRNRALRVRALAEVLDAHRPSANRTIALSALISWRVARVVTGRLRAHPNLSYQQEPSRIHSWFDRADVFLIGTTARYADRGVRVYAAELQCLAREVDDTRALTRDQELSDTLGRAQRQFRRLLQELGGAPDNAALPRLDTNPRPAADWPYLAI